MAKRTVWTKCVLEAAKLDPKMNAEFLEICEGGAHGAKDKLMIASQKYYVQIFKISPTDWPSGYDPSKVNWAVIKKQFEI